MVVRFSSNSLLVRIIAREASRLLRQIRMNVYQLDEPNHDPWADTLPCLSQACQDHSLDFKLRARAVPDGDPQ